MRGDRGAGFIASHVVNSLMARGWIGDMPKMQLSIAKLKGLGWSHRRSSEENGREAVRAMMG